MPNFATALKDEIVRLARKELRKEIEGLRKSTSQHRSDISALKRQVATLEKQLGKVEKRGPKKALTEEALEPGTPLRFSAERFASQRQKLGLSALDMGTLVGVSAQTIYNWEGGKSRPRPSQLAAVAGLRKIGKREARARLSQE